MSRAGAAATQKTILILLVAGMVLGLTASALVFPTFGQIIDPANAVFLLETITQEGDNPKGVGYGTAFFISQDGTAITNSHIVYRAQHDPDHYQLIAIIDKEFYSVEIACASRLTWDPTKPNSAGVRVGRDIAKIKVMPSTFSFETWRYKFKTGEELTVATAHRESLPEFPVLTIADHPREGEHISVIGYGHISPFPERWTATGLIDEMGRASDGTEVFSVQFTNPAQPGNSGSPVLDENDQVIGYGHGLREVSRIAGPPRATVFCRILVANGLGELKANHLDRSNSRTGGVGCDGEKRETSRNLHSRTNGSHGVRSGD